MWQQIKACRHGQEAQRFSDQMLQLGTRDQSEFDRGMIVGARQGGLSLWISETAGIVMHNFLYLYRMVQKTKKQQPLCGQKCLVNERGQWRRARLVKATRKVTITQITTHYNSGMQKSISEHNASYI